MMVGRELDRTVISAPDKIGDVLLDVRQLSGARFENVTFQVRTGEIVAFSGLVGAGRSEVASAIFGADRFTGGQLIFDGRPVRFKSPKDAIRAGIAMVQEDRKVLSLFMNMTIARNMTMAELPFMSKGVTNERAEQQLAAQHDLRRCNLPARRLHVQAAPPARPARLLPGDLC